MKCVHHPCKAKARYVCTPPQPNLYGPAKLCARHAFDHRGTCRTVRRLPRKVSITR